MHLVNAPLVQVLAQVVFSQVPGLETRIEQLHQRFFEAGYLIRVDGSVHDIRLSADGPPSVRVRPRWEFLDRDRAWSVSLTDQFVVLGTVRYLSAEPFWERLQEVLEIVRDVAGVQLIERLGLRYIDVVRPRAGESFVDYVDASVLGFPLETLGAVQVIESVRTEKLARTEQGRMIARSMLLPPGVAAPPDLTGELRHVPPSDPTLPGLVLDFDHFHVFETLGDFDPESIVQQMEGLRLPLREAFRLVITEHAESVWGPWVSESEVSG